MYNEDIPVESLAQRLCDLKQGYTQYGGAPVVTVPLLNPLHHPRCLLLLLCTMTPGLRPFGVSLLYAGYDPHYEFQLYHSDPSGNYSGWKATCIGANNGTATSLLKQEYKEDISVEAAIELVLRTMSKTMDSTTLGSEKRTSRTLPLTSRILRSGRMWRTSSVDVDTDVWLGRGQWSSRHSPSMLTRNQRQRSTSRPRSTLSCRSTGWGRRMRTQRCRRHDRNRNRGSSLTL